MPLNFLNFLNPLNRYKKTSESAFVGWEVWRYFVPGREGRMKKRGGKRGFAKQLGR